MFPQMSINEKRNPKRNLVLINNDERVRDITYYSDTDFDNDQLNSEQDQVRGRVYYK